MPLCVLDRSSTKRKAFILALVALMHWQHDFHLIRQGIWLCLETFWKQNLVILGRWNIVFKGRKSKGSNSWNCLPVFEKLYLSVFGENLGRLNIRPGSQASSHAEMIKTDDVIDIYRKQRPEWILQFHAWGLKKFHEAMMSCSSQSASEISAPNQMSEIYSALYRTWALSIYFRSVIWRKTWERTRLCSDAAQQVVMVRFPTNQSHRVPLFRNHCLWSTELWIVR